MTYYRLAVQGHQSTHWIWKTTPVTSLQAVLQLLRSYRVLPQDGIRVFSASSEAELNEMLSRENNHLESGSVTAAQFLHERHLSVPERAQSAWEQHVPEQTLQQGTGAVAWATWELHKATHATQHGADDATWAREVWEKHQAAQAAQHGADRVPASPLREHLAAPGALSSASMDSQEQKRLEIELGPGGDHDTTYLFTLPITLKEQLAWLQLQAQVKAGELQS